MLLSLLATARAPAAEDAEHPEARAPAATGRAPAARGAEQGPAALAARLPRVFVHASDEGALPVFTLAGSPVSARLETGAMTWIVRGADEHGDPIHAEVVLAPLAARDGVAPAGERSQGRVGLFRGAPEQWRTGRPTFGAVRYPGLWPGVDLLLEADGDRLKSTWQLQPGVDPACVRVAVHGSASARVDEHGRLVLHTRAGEVVDEAPVAWQPGGADVPVAFALASDGDGRIVVGFEVGAHDPRLPLLIDPAVLSQAGFLGGAGDDEVHDVAVGPDGSLFVCGSTTSTEATFPVIAGPGLRHAGPTTSRDAFVARLDPTGRTLLYAGFIGGGPGTEDVALAIAVDALGRALVTGRTASTERDGFPATGPVATFGGGTHDAWAARVSADGTRLEWCTYLGGDGGEESGAGIAAAADLGALVVGHTDAQAGSLPLARGPTLRSSGGQDVFLARIAPDGGAFDSFGLLGGGDLDEAAGVALLPDGRIALAGSTFSTAATFPVLGGPDPTHNGNADGFVALLSADATTLQWCGYLGGNLADLVHAIAVDAAGDVYVAGQTSSGPGTFPVLVGPALSAPGGVLSGFVAKVGSDGVLQRCGYVGGAASDLVLDLAVDEQGGAWLVGQTFSATLPAGGGWDGSANGLADGFVARVRPSGLAFDWAAFLGGDGIDRLSGIALLPAGGEAARGERPPASTAWVVGSVRSTEASLPVAGGPELVHAGGYDGLLARIDATPPVVPEVTLAMSGTKGSLRDAKKTGKDRFRYRADVDAGALGLDPERDGLLLSFGALDLPVEVGVPAGDPGWTVKTHKLVWKTAKGVHPRVRLTFHLGKGRIAFDADRFDFDPPPHLPLGFTLQAGEEYAAPPDEWAAGKKPGRYKLVK